MAASRRPLFFLSALLVVVGVELATMSVASAANAAGDPAAVAKVTNLNKKALDAYAQQDYDTARDLLKQALELCDSAGLQQHPITARTHVHFGVVAIVGFKNREVGLKQFRKALEIEPDIKLTKSLVTPELQDAFEEAVLASDKGGGGGGAAAAGGNDNAGGGDLLAAARRTRVAATTTPAARPRVATTDDEDHPKPKTKPLKKKTGDDDGKDKGDEGNGQDGDDLPRPDHRLQRRHGQRQRPHEPAHALGGPGLRGRPARADRAADRDLRELDDHAVDGRSLPVRERPQRREPLRAERHQLLQPDDSRRRRAGLARPS